MITLTNGVNTITVSNGAYEQRYKSMGYRPVGKAATTSKQSAAKKEDAPVVNEPVIDGNDEFIESFVALPKANWSKDDMVRVCEIFGIDTSKAKNVGEAKNILEKALKAKNVM